MDRFDPILREYNRFSLSRLNLISNSPINIYQIRKETRNLQKKILILIVVELSYFLDIINLYLFQLLKCIKRIDIVCMDLHKSLLSISHLYPLDSKFFYESLSKNYFLKQFWSLTYFLYQIFHYVIEK